MICQGVCVAADIRSTIDWHPQDESVLCPDLSCSLIYYPVTLPEP